MSESFNEFQRKVKNRQFAIDNSWRGDGVQQPPENPPEPDGPSQHELEPAGPCQNVWDGLGGNLSEADACKLYDGYFQLYSHRKILGPIIIFFKKVVRKLLKVFLGWYLFPIYAQQNRFNEKVLNAACLEQDILLTLNANITQLQKQLAEMRGINALQADALAELHKQNWLQVYELAELRKQYRLHADTLSELNKQGRFHADALAELDKHDRLHADALAELDKQGRLHADALAELAENDAKTSDRLWKIENLPTEDDAFYHSFEEKFRGSRWDIKDRLQMYVPIVKEHLPSWEEGRFVDVGSGRGEWLDILKENNAVDYVGVDLNAQQNALCESLGHKTVCEDCIQYLTKQPDESVDLISGFQVIEHLCMSDLMELLRQSYRVLKKGGMILFETQNPRNLIVGSDTFYIDPSHKRPLEPRMIEFLAQWCGFTNVVCIDANSHPDWAGVTGTSKTEENSEIIEKINKLYWLVFGPQDYAVFAVKE